jgi:hypothetical protein
MRQDRHLMDLVRETMIGEMIELQYGRLTIYCASAFQYQQITWGGMRLIHNRFRI